MTMYFVVIHKAEAAIFSEDAKRLWHVVSSRSVSVASFF